MRKLQLILGISLIYTIFFAVPLIAEPKHKMAMVLPCEKTDEAFNQCTCEGMVRAAKEFGSEIAYKEDGTRDQALEVIRQSSEPGNGIVIGQGSQFGEALQTAAKDYPDADFAFSVATNTGASRRPGARPTIRRSEAPCA